MFPPLLLPYREEDSNRLSEQPQDYIERVAPLLPNWPEELLREWLHRHHVSIPYLHLDLHLLVFRQETWPLAALPGEEAFENPNFCHNMKGKVSEPARYRSDWLLQVMLETGTWPTPIVLLKTRGTSLKDTWGQPLKTPIHLLEGHRRLAYFNGLRDIGGAKEDHDVFVATFG